MTVLRAGGPVVAQDKASHRKVAEDLVRCHRKAMVAWEWSDNGMRPNVDKKRPRVPLKSPTRRIQKIKTRQLIVKSNQENTTNS